MATRRVWHNDKTSFLCCILLKLVGSKVIFNTGNNETNEFETAKLITKGQSLSACSIEGEGLEICFLHVLVVIIHVDTNISREGIWRDLY
mmetsp:Transcript_23962/g.36499  ORF Transcript_23962/g.36499 Transcript_23962/m.36499 type:complete len:90 (+) Transcript_23962:132-401(+)